MFTVRDEVGYAYKPLKTLVYINLPYCVIVTCIPFSGPYVEPTSMVSVIPADDQSQYHAHKLAGTKV